MQRKAIAIGITGGIGSGKSNVAKNLRDLGAKVLDADLLGHSVYEPNTDAYHRVVSVFGKEVVGVDGKIDRRILGSKVFGDKMQMKKLTDIVWPAIAEKAKQEMIRLQESEHAEVIVLEAAVLLEAGWQQLVDSVWVTTVPVEVAVERIMKRNNLTAQDAIARINSQMSNEERISKASLVIDTNGPFEQTRERVVNAWNLFRKQYGLN